MVKKPILKRSGGRLLCVSHASTGAPVFHTEGCEACADARAKGIIRPDVTTVSMKERRSQGLRQTQRGFIDWNKRVRVKKALARANQQQQQP